MRQRHGIWGGDQANHKRIPFFSYVEVTARSLFALLGLFIHFHLFITVPPPLSVTPWPCRSSGYKKKTVIINCTPRCGARMTQNKTSLLVPTPTASWGSALRGLPLSRLLEIDRACGPVDPPRSASAGRGSGICTACFFFVPSRSRGTGARWEAKRCQLKCLT